MKIPDMTVMYKGVVTIKEMTDTGYDNTLSLELLNLNVNIDLGSFDKKSGVIVFENEKARISVTITKKLIKEILKQGFGEY